MKNVLLSKDNFPNFVSNLLNIPEQVVVRVMPKGEDRRILNEAFRASVAPSSGEMPVSLEEALSLYLIVRILKPKYVVETGVSSGRSSTFILLGLYNNGERQLYSIDPNPNSGYAIPRDLRGRWKFINTTSAEGLPNLLAKLGQIDVFLHDSLHTYECMSFEYKTAWPHIRPGGILLSDDVGTSTAFRHFCQSIAKNAIIIYLNKDFAACRKCV